MVVAVVVVLAGLSGAACGDDEPDTAPATSMATAPSPTPTPAPTTPAETTPPAVSPTSPTATSTPLVPVPPTPPTPAADVAFAHAGGLMPVQLGPGAAGSGCAPGPGMLPDGIWVGTGEDLRPTAIEFDLVCFYDGEAAAAEAAARGLESPPDDDLLIVNDNTTLRTVPVAPDAGAWRLTDVVGEGVVLVETTYADFRVDVGQFQASPGTLLVLYVNDGAVTEVVSQYVP